MRVEETFANAAEAWLREYGFGKVLYAGARLMELRGRLGNEVEIVPLATSGDDTPSGARLAIIEPLAGSELAVRSLITAVRDQLKPGGRILCLLPNARHFFDIAMSFASEAAGDPAETERDIPMETAVDILSEEGFVEIVETSIRFGYGPSDEIGPTGHELDSVEEIDPARRALLVHAMILEATRGDAATSPPYSAEQLGALWNDGRQSEAADYLRTYLSKPSGRADVWNDAAVIMTVVGEIEDALYCARRAYSIDPLSVHGTEVLASLLNPPSGTSDTSEQPAWEAPVEELLARIEELLAAGNPSAAVPLAENVAIRQPTKRTFDVLANVLEANGRESSAEEVLRLSREVVSLFDETPTASGDL